MVRAVESFACGAAARGELHGELPFQPRLSGLPVADAVPGNVEFHANPIGHLAINSGIFSRNSHGEEFHKHHH